MAISTLTRRDFAKLLLSATGSFALLPTLTQAGNGEGFSFVLLGDLHFDRLAHHDVSWLERDKPDDLRQVKDYSRITADLLPSLFAAVRQQIAQLGGSGQTPPAFVLQLGDFVEGLCGNEALAVRQNKDAVEFVSHARLGVPFLFTKGNHDTTGPGAAEAFKEVFPPFIGEQAARLGGSKPEGARYAIEHRQALFCFFDAYDPASLDWLEAALAKRTARHCFVALHPPVVPYGARATWNIFSGDAQKSKRERLLELLGKHRVFVLSGHIHKYNLLARATPSRGRFLQFALSSVIPRPTVTPRNILSGVKEYTPDQVDVEPDFSPKTLNERRAVYEAEAPWVTQFEYADLPGYAVVTVQGPQVTASLYSGASRQLWRKLDFTKFMET